MVMFRFKQIYLLRKYIYKSVQAYIDCAYKQSMITKAEIKKINFPRGDAGLTSVVTEISLPLFTNTPSAMNP